MRTFLVVFFWFLQVNMNGDCIPLVGGLSEWARANYYYFGYIFNDATGLGYKIVYQSETWPIARDRCDSQGAKLAVPETEADFTFIQQMVREMYYPRVQNSDYKQLVWLGINNLDDYRVWKTVDGKNLNTTQFNIWAEGNGAGDAVEEPHCAGMDPINHGFRDWWCHRRQPFVCVVDIKSKNLQLA